MEQQGQISQPSLPGVPEGPPREALEYREAVRRYQASTSRPAGDVDIAAAHLPRLKLRTWQRRKKHLRDGHWGGRDWIEIWPPPHDWHPSWESLLVPLNGVDDDNVVRLIYEETYDKTSGDLIKRRLIQTLGHLGAVAAMWAYFACVNHDFLRVASHLGRHFKVA